MFHGAVTIGLIVAVVALGLWTSFLHDISDQQEQLIRTMHICLESPRYDTFEKAKACLDQARQTRVDVLLGL